MIKLVYPTIGGAEIASVIKVLKSGHLERGGVTLRLEKMLQERFNSRHSVVTTNGTAALFVGLLACGISSGDEVITTPFSFIATINVILLCAAIPIFIDIDQDTFNIDVSKIEAKITNKTKAILAVDLYGHPAKYDDLRALANKHKLLLISDSCQAIGAQYQGKAINHYADITTFSFFNSKNISSGEGGVLLTNQESIANKANLLINHGQKRGEKYSYLNAGWNFRPTDIQSSVMQAQLKRLDTICAKRRKNAEYLTNNLSAIKGIICPTSRPYIRHTFSRYAIRVTSDFLISRDKLKKHLDNNRIESEIVYPKPLYSYPHTTQYKNGEFPIVESVVKEILCLPVHQNLKKNDLNHIVKVIKNIH